MRPSQLLAGLVAFSSVSAAWPDMFDSINALGDVKNVLYGRQNDNSEPSSSARETQAASSSREQEPESTGESRSSRASATNSDSEPQSTGRASGTQRQSGTRTTGRPRSTEFDPRLPAGGIQMVTPAAIAGAQYYKIGDWVTFAWNYTSLSVTPSAIDIMASCSANQATYTIALNQTVEATGRIEWDTNATQATPYLTETYTLLIYDSQSSVSATAKAGYLGTFNQFTFGMYQPQSYTPYSADYKCANCSGALSAFETLTLKALLLTVGTTVVSLLYFSSSFGVW